MPIRLASEVIANGAHHVAATANFDNSGLCSGKRQCSQPSRRFGAMMRKLDQRGVAALEFCLVAVPFFTLMFAIFDLGRYAITMQSLRTLANAGARAMMINAATQLP